MQYRWVMNNHRGLGRRKSIRLKGYDYSQAGLYFITMCSQNQLCLFGEVENAQMRLSDAGKMIEKWWGELKHKYNNIELHEQIIMPNHFHGIIQIINETGPITGNTSVTVGADLCVCPNERCQLPKKGEHTGSPLHRMIQWFKTMSTNEYIKGVKNNDWRPFNKKLWQRNYYEHVIRNEKSYHQISQYIQTNPLKWQNDKYYA